MNPTPPGPAFPRRRRRGATIGIVAISMTAGVAVLAALIVPSLSSPETAPPSRFPLIELDAETLPPGLEFADPEDVELLSDPMDLDVLEWQTSLQSAFAGNPNFGSPAISPDGTVFTIIWFGEPTEALRQRIAAAPAGLDVLIQPAAHPPGELQQLVERAMQPGFIGDLQIAIGSVENDASGIRFGLAAEPEGRTLDEIGRMLAESLGRPDVPVHVEVSGAVIPISG